MATYQTILTAYGANKIANAIAHGTAINLTQMAVGDGAGFPVTPSTSQTALVNEKYRTSINTVYQDPANPLVLFVEMLIASATGGWWIREFGIFDDTGALFAVGNFPETYKTLPSDGAVNDLAIRGELVVSSAGVITLQVDPAVTVATRQWVLSNITGASLIPGGTTGQVLTKDNNLDGGYSWHAPGSTTVIVDTLEERTTVTASPQTTFNLTTVTTTGLAVYVEGVRIPKKPGSGGWQQGASNTQVVLGDQYPIGHELTFCQNEPVSHLPQLLDANQNLADLPNVATARSNLGLGSLARKNAIESLAVSVAANAMTVNYAGGVLDFRNFDLTNGAPYVGVTVPANSITIPQGATLGATSGSPARFWLLEAYNGGSPVLCVTNNLGGLQLDETKPISPTTISTGATSANVIYSASAVSANSPYRVIGFLDNTQSIAGTYASAPTFVQGAGGQALVASVSQVPSGSIMPFAGETPPSGWLECDGSSLLRASYPTLFSAIGTLHGAADGTHFNLPDYRGRFLRGWNHGASNDPDASSRTASNTGGATGNHVGTFQSDAFQGHEHQLFDLRNGGGGGYNGAGAVDWTRNTQAIVQKGGYSAPRYADETRPVNVSVMYIIKY